MICILPPELKSILKWHFFEVRYLKLSFYLQKILTYVHVFHFLYTCIETVYVSIYNWKGLRKRIYSKDRLQGSKKDLCEGLAPTAFNKIATIMLGIIMLFKELSKWKEMKNIIRMKPSSIFNKTSPIIG